MKFKLKYFFFTVVFLLATQIGFSQKPILTDTSFRSWSYVSNGQLSGNGNFLCYQVIDKSAKTNILTLAATDKKWERKFNNLRNPGFSDDSKYFVALSKGDTLYEMNLVSDKILKIPECQIYELFRHSGEEYLMYLVKDSINTMIIKNLKKGTVIQIHNTIEYILNRDFGTLLVKRKNSLSSPDLLQWVNLASGKADIFFEGDSTSGFIFNSSGKGIAFTRTINNATSVWYYEKGDNTAIEIANDRSQGLVQNFKINTEDIWTFANDDKILLCTLIEPRKDNVMDESAPDVWSYQDAFLFPEFKSYRKDGHDGINLTSIDIKNKKVKQLLHGTQKIVFGPSSMNKIAIVQSSFGNTDDLPWNLNAKVSYYLCFLETGELAPFKLDCSVPINLMELSPDNNYLVYFDGAIKEYLSYNLVTKKTVNLTSAVHYEIGKFDEVGRRINPISNIAGWLPNIHSVVIQGVYDLWKFNLDGKSAPVNLTGGYGTKNHIIFSLGKLTQEKVLQENQELLLAAFYRDTKEGGIFTLDLRKKSINLLFKTTRFFVRPYGNILSPNYFTKAKNVEAYLIKNEDVSSSGNYVFTKDFHTFSKITFNNPESNYNWLTSELITYYDDEGEKCEAILYKPENFDPGKKYPVILNYYLENSYRVHDYIKPEPDMAGINIPLLVSSGYIVCKPNIYFKRQDPGNSLLKSVNAAADYLSKFSWIDSTMMGITGHSLGGWETNFIVTHSNRFAAALSAAGTSNLIQGYNALATDASTSDQGYIKRALKLEVGLDSIPDIYIQNSPIINAKNIQTPLLIMHNPNDGNVNVSQSTQFFIQLRSLQKKVWLLQYKKEDHIIMNERNQLDYQRKVQSFFDYYLRNSPMPEWMSNHISVK